MLTLKYLLITCGLGMMIVAVCILAYDLYRELLYRRALETPGGAAGAAPVVVRWRTSLALAMLAWGPLLMAFSIVVVPSGTAGRAGQPDERDSTRHAVSRSAHGRCRWWRMWRCSIRGIKSLLLELQKAAKPSARVFPRGPSF